MSIGVFLIGLGLGLSVGVAYFYFLIGKVIKQKESVEKAVVFVKHIENHMKEMSLDEKRHGKVMCKMCCKTIDEIYEAEK